jgi:hypothetical protein
MLRTPPPRRNRSARTACADTRARLSRCRRTRMRAETAPMFTVFAVLLPLLIVGAIPPRVAPWVELKLDDPPGRVRDWKQARATSAPERCLAVLTENAVEHTALPDRETGPGCGFRNAVRIDRIGEATLTPVSLSCRATLSLALWERQDLQPLARALLGAPVRRLEHFGSYACRGVYGREDARRSSHATADALDVAGLVLTDGRRLRIARDHRLTAREPDAATARFLDEIEQRACRSFSVVLGPSYNAAHRDHFHLEKTGGMHFCR